MSILRPKGQRKCGISRKPISRGSKAGFCRKHYHRGHWTGKR